MNKIFNFIRNRHEELYKVFLFAITIAIVVSLFPKEGKFKYEYTKGKPWLHQELIAPFDFAILKTDEELKIEEEAARRSSALYFKYDTLVKAARMENFAREFAIEWDKRYNADSSKKISSHNLSSLKQNTRKTGLSLLEKTYEKGIIELNDEMDSTNRENIFVFESNIAAEAQLSDFFTLQSAYNFIQGELLKYDRIDKSLLTQLVENNLAHNVIYDASTSNRALEEQLSNISLTRGKIQKDVRIVSKGELIDNEKFEILESLRSEYLAQRGGLFNQWVLILGQVILSILAILILYFFLYLFRKDIINDNLRLSFILLMIALIVMMASLAHKFDFVILYALPFSILPIVIRTFYDTRLALFTHLVTCLLIGFFAPKGFEFVFIQLVAGIFAVFSIVNLSKRSQLFLTAVVVFATYSLTYIGFSFVEEGNLVTLQPKYFWWFAINALFTLSSYPLIYLFEKIFGFISDVTLMELSDTNSPLLRELALKAPGTFQHSLQVANLAEEAIYEVGGDTLLVRTGALYHDIGKMEMPRFFIENQVTGNNPHEELSFDESAQIIISHVIKGIEKAKKHNLPDKVIDFIRTHHGDSMVQYFYRSYLKQFPDEMIDEKKFRYPGPRPFSKETAVLMMADSVEAASRSLKRYDMESLDQLVEKVIGEQVSQNQFANANITFKDISVIKKIFKKKLLNIYHVRIEYPK